jgi:hypothetical protein
MALGIPVYIDPVTLGNQPTNLTPFPSMMSGPWEFGGALYTALTPTPSPAANDFADIWKSTDNGVTWVALDHTSAPTFGGFQCSYDGVSTITLIGVVLPVPSGLQIIQFDLTTELWGTLDAPTAFTSPAAPFVLLERGSDKLIIYGDFVTSFLFAVTWNGVYGVPFQMDINAVATLTGFGGINQVWGVLDSGNDAHIFMIEADGAFTPFNFYQEITAANALTTFQAFGSLNEAWGVPCFESNTVILPFVDNGTSLAGVYTGTPLAGPVFTRRAAIDPLFTGSSFQPAAQMIGGVLYVVYTGANSTPTGVIRQSITTDFVTWVFTSTSEYDSDVPPFIGFPGNELIGIFPSQPGFAVMAIDPSSTQFQRVFFPFATPPIVLPPFIQLNAQALLPVALGTPGTPCK